MDTSKDYYYILGVKHDATHEEIKSAYKKLATKFHPDKNDGDDFFSERFKEILEAWEVLGNQSKRSDYDYKKFGYSKNENQYPKIISFTVNKKDFVLDDEIIFSWETLNADRVNIKPFGLVPPSGSKTYKIKSANVNTLHYELSAENTQTSNSVKSTISISKKVESVTQSSIAFDLHSWIEFNEDQIIIVFKRLALIIATIYLLIIAYPELRDWIVNGNYEPLKIKYLMYSFGGDWALFADWVYSPQSFVGINTLIGWIFKLIFWMPLPLLFILIFYGVTFLFMKAILWVVKLVSSKFGTIGGMVAIVTIFVLLVKWLV